MEWSEWNSTFFFQSFQNKMNAADEMHEIDD